MNKFIITIIFIIIGTTNGFSQKERFTDVVPQGYILYKAYYGDLNKDGKEDCVLIIKGTDVKNVVVNRFEKKVDRNRRGIVILLSKNDTYEAVVTNSACFMSENEDGGVYYPPQISIEIENGDLNILYNHGRYGHWSYTFRYQELDFELIEYRSTSNYGPITMKKTRIDFLSKKKSIKENTNEDAEGNDEIFKETITTIKVDKLIKLSEIKDFYNVDLSVY